MNSGGETFAVIATPTGLKRVENEMKMTTFAALNLMNFSDCIKELSDVI